METTNDMGEGEVLSFDPTIALLHSVLLGPFFGGLVVLISVIQVDSRDFLFERMIRVGVSEERADREKNFSDAQCRRPCRVENVQADLSIQIDVRMIDFCSEFDFGSLEGVVGGEVDGQEEDSTLIGRIRRAHDSSLPVVDIISVRTRTAPGRRITFEVLQFLLDSPESHFLFAEELMRDG